MRFIVIALPMILVATSAIAAQPRSFENLDRLDSLVTMTEEVLVDPAIAGRARLAVERMVNLKQ